MLDAVDVISAHHERAVVAVGDVVLKIDAEGARLGVEVEAMALASAGGVPVPAVRWREGEVLALARLPGRALARLGEPDALPAEAWEAAGAVARRLHRSPLPPWEGWEAAGFAAHADACARWIVDEGVVESSVVDRVRALAEPALRPCEVVFIHGDLQAEHVFIDESSRVVGVIDWSDACQGDALFDLAVLTVGFAEHLDDVLRGYGGAGDVDRDVIRGYWAIRRLGSVRWMVEHGFDPAGDIASVRRMAAGEPGYV
jgi:aminoglycoside phosphotransferase (APT) family kinase protein